MHAYVTAIFGMIRCLVVSQLMAAALRSDESVRGAPQPGCVVKRPGFLFSLGLVRFSSNQAMNHFGLAQTRLGIIPVDKTYSN